ncbi:MAG TPA: cobalamin-binding protein [Clostridiales bacterium]|nr:cobalamin-binding protein [Clostridiales bacterium]
MSTINKISLAVQNGNRKQVLSLVQQAIDEGLPAKEILESGLLAGMDVVGQRFVRNETFIPEVLVSARAMSSGTELLKPLLAEGEVDYLGRVLIGTVEGDLHDIGKNLVKLMIESKGVEVIDIGIDAPAEKFINTAMENDCKIICCSALLTTAMSQMETVVEKANEAGIRDKVKIMVGGAPVTQGFCDKIGADYYTPDATTAVEKVVEILKSMAQ